MTKRNRYSWVWALGIWLVGATAASAGVTWYVDDDTCPDQGSGTSQDPYCSIQDGIDAASNEDTVEVSPGTYYEVIDFDGKAITVRSTNPSNPSIVATTIIDGTGLDTSVVKCVNDEGSDTVLDGLTVTGGSASYGGGMYNAGSSPTVVRCTFTENLAGNMGGGMYNASGQATVTDCTFSGNTIAAVYAGNGGGMCNVGGSPTVAGCTFTGNSAGWMGGGMYNVTGQAEVTDCTFSGNTIATLGLGGGMANRDNPSGYPVISNCVFEENEVAGTSAGGAMYNDNQATSSFPGPKVTDCVFRENSADVLGSAIYSCHSGPTLTNCTFSGNTGCNSAMAHNSDRPYALTGCVFSGNSGDGLWSWLGGGSAVNCVFTGNGAAGVRSTNTTTVLTNCIVWGNTTSEIVLDGGTISVTYSDVGGGWEGEGNINADPLFRDADGLDDTYGTADDNLRLQWLSPCIDAGDGDAIDEDSDMDGNPRFVDEPYVENTGVGTQDYVDMGPYEFQAEALKNRYISVRPWALGMVSYRIEMTESDYFPDVTGVLGWVGQPDQDGISRVVGSPYYSSSWPQAVHIGDCDIVPAATYRLRSKTKFGLLSSPVDYATTPAPTDSRYWGDIAGWKANNEWMPPDGVVNFNDITAVLECVTGAPTAPPLVWVDIAPQTPDKTCNMTDLQMVIQAFQANPYPWGCPPDDPCGDAQNCP